MIRDYVMAFADYYENSYSKHAWKLKIFESLYGPNYKVKNTLQVPYTEFYYTETSPFCLYAQNNQDYWDGKGKLSNCVKLDFKDSLPRFEKMVNNSEIIEFIRKRNIKTKVFHDFGTFKYLRGFFDIKLKYFDKDSYVKLIPNKDLTIFDLKSERCTFDIFEEKQMSKIRSKCKNTLSILDNTKHILTADTILGQKDCYDYCNKKCSPKTINVCKVSKNTDIICCRVGHKWWHKNIGILSSGIK